MSLMKFAITMSIRREREDDLEPFSQVIEAWDENQARWDGSFLAGARAIVSMSVQRMPDDAYCAPRRW